ncbi:MAG: hypothetical protein HYX49_02950 [Chloroflexi bacterium]|nr:hypothetical protein [Chloroflexota bacterium]
MNIQDILLIYEYNYWANQRVLAQCKNVTLEQFIAAAEPQRGSPNLRSARQSVFSKEI